MPPPNGLPPSFLRLLLLVGGGSFASAQQTAAPATSSPTERPTDLPTPSPLYSAVVGCPPLWTVGGDYDPGSLVSHSDGGGIGSGTVIRGVYACKEAPYHLYCPQSGFEPGSTHSDSAWTFLGGCDSSTAFVEPTASPTSDAPTYALWEKGGCPESYEGQTPPYPGGTVVENDGVVYECAEEWPTSARCGQTGWAPGTGEWWTEAWTALGRCEGTREFFLVRFVRSLLCISFRGSNFRRLPLRVRPFPVFPRPSFDPRGGVSVTPTLSPSAGPTEGLPLWDRTGCPEPYAEGTDYASDATVSDGGNKVYQCKEWPYNLLCGMAGYAPGVDVDYEEAWTVLGSCDGTLSPTAAPTSVSPTTAPTWPQWDKVGCPEEYDGTFQTSYEAGDVVTRNGHVYECGSEAERCRQSGYEPEEGQSWREVWTVLGSCAGTIAPSPQPSVALWDKVGCPEEWDSSGSAGYKVDDAVTSDGVVYRCTDDFDDAFCNVLPPTDPDWNLTWEKMGSCTGTLAPTVRPTLAPSSAPTTSPTWTQWDRVGCPQEYDATYATVYESGDLVSYDGHVYACGGEAGRCRQGGYEPGVGQYWTEAWTILGSCAGTMVPTGSPTRPILPAWQKGGCPDPWDGTANYVYGSTVSAYGMYVYECMDWPDTGFCAMYEPEEDARWSAGWVKLGGCSGTLAPTEAPTTLAPTPPIDCSACSAPAYDPSTTYYATNVTSSGLGGTCRQYTCRDYPYELWCSNPAYAPGGSLSSSAWNNVGAC
ncbi:hypothetical protein ACHAWF_006389 [Thalassiosira exigua]